MIGAPMVTSNSCIVELVGLLVTRMCAWISMNRQIEKIKIDRYGCSKTQPHT